MACSAFVVKTVRTAIRERRPLDGALVALHGELRNASRQVNAVGVNLNQLARYANARGDIPNSLPVRRGNRFGSARCGLPLLTGCCRTTSGRKPLRN
ncbi:hypothetical protein DMH08_15510 [Actinomadura sp. WAC 06369]|nr:hypothetical protein DMH08_15510 [Actinomadura sp. WAC 06369]